MQQKVANTTSSCSIRLFLITASPCLVSSYVILIIAYRLMPAVRSLQREIEKLLLIVKCEIRCYGDSDAVCLVLKILK